MFRSPSAAEFGWGSAGLSTRFLETDDQGVAGGGALDADALDRMLLSGNQAAPADSWDSALGEAALPCDSEPGAAGEQPTAADLAQPQPPQAPATPVLCASSGGLLRCIDESHPQGCKRCTPAPLDPAGVELVGEHGKKNGEKILRSLVTRIPEWNLASERRKLVPLARAAGLAPLAVALEEKKTSALRKAHLIFMARSWGYKCDLWTPKHDRAADRAMEQLQRRALAEAQHKPASSEPGSQVAEPQPPQQQQQQQAALPSFPLPRFGECAAAAWSGAWDEGLLVPEAVWLFTQKSLRPLSLRVAAGFAGDDARAAALVHGDAHVTATLAAEVLVVAGMMPTVCAQLGAVHAAVNAALRSLPADRASSPAWRVLCAPPFDGTDAMLRGVLESASSLVGAVARSSSLRIRRGGLSPAEHVWLEEMYGSLSCTLELLGHVSRVLSAFRSAPLDGFLTVSANMLELMIVLVTSLGSASTQREQWMQAMIKARGAGCSAAAPDRAKLLVCYGDASDELNGAGAAQGGAGAAEMAQ